MRYRRYAALTAALLLAFGFTASAETANNSDTYEQLRLFGDVFEKVRADYVEEVTDAQLIESAINGMLTALDPHSSYLNAKNFEEMQVQTKGEFGGLGIEVTMENGVVKVVSPIDDTPASRAGVQPGDYIVQLDGKPVMGLTLSDAVEMMRGPVDSEITLTLQRGEQDPFDVKLKRAIIKIQSVRSRLEGDIAYLRVTSFSEQSGRPARSGHRDFRRLPRQGRDRFDPRPQTRRFPALQRPARRHHQRLAGSGADQWRLGLGLGDRRWRLAGSSPRDPVGHQVLRQRLGPDHHSGSRPGRHSPDDRALFHALGPLHPGDRHRARHHRRAGPGRTARPAAPHHRGRFAGRAVESDQQAGDRGRRQRGSARAGARR
jgi:hypothetical protein